MRTPRRTHESFLSPHGKQESFPRLLKTISPLQQPSLLLPGETGGNNPSRLGYEDYKYWESIICKLFISQHSNENPSQDTSPLQRSSLLPPPGETGENTPSRPQRERKIVSVFGWSRYIPVKYKFPVYDGCLIFLGRGEEVLCSNLVSALCCILS